MLKCCVNLILKSRQTLRVWASKIENFWQIGDLLKNVKSERDQLKAEIKNLSILIESQREYIASIENSEDKKKGKLKGLIKIWLIKAVSN
jgi:hypothetical protein